MEKNVGAVNVNEMDEEVLAVAAKLVTPVG